MSFVKRMWRALRLEGRSLVGERVVAELDGVEVEGVIIKQSEAEDGAVWFTIRADDGEEHLIHNEDVMAME